MKTGSIIAAFVAAVSVNVLAAPAADNFHSVTNDWWNGNYTNVYELAQLRYAANTNDLVAAHIMAEYDMSFSSREAISNSAMRLVRIADGVTHPALTNIYAAVRGGMIRYASVYVPTWTDAELEEQHQRASAPHRTMNCDFVLELISENGLWPPLGE